MYFVYKEEFNTVWNYILKLTDKQININFPSIPAFHFIGAIGAFAGGKKIFDKKIYNRRNDE